MNGPYYKYVDYLKNIYNQRVQKVTVDGGFTCPNRDGKISVGGCTYCNNRAFGPPSGHNKLSIGQQITTSIEHLKKRYKAKKFIAYFQTYSNTYAPLEHLKELYQSALDHPEVIGLSIGTRPDCIDNEKLDYLQQLSEKYEISIEYGLESKNDETLKKVNRGHDYQCFLDAVKLTKNRGIKICAHTILGFPWEKPEEWTDTAKELSKLPIDFLKLHQLHIVKNTQLHQQFIETPFQLLTSEEYISVVIDFLKYLSPKIAIQRLVGEAPKDLLVAPNWDFSGSQITQTITKQMQEQNIVQGMNFSLPQA